MTDFATPNSKHPVLTNGGSPHLGTVFLAAAISHPRIDVGDYTYASAHTPPKDWAAHLAPYLYDFSPERLSIGKFCQFADSVQFITSSANHRFDGISSFPFAIFGDGPIEGRPSMPQAGPDTIIGHDCWIGSGAIILPGAQLGDGVIIGAGAVVGGRVPDYSIVTGNPAKVRRMRFEAKDIARIKSIAWWHWPIEKILLHEGAITGGDIDALQNAAN